MKAATLLVLVCLAAALPAQGAEVRTLGRFGAWTAYLTREDEGPVCYAATGALDSVGRRAGGRAAPMLLVSNRPAAGEKNVISVSHGTAFADDSPALLAIGKSTFRFATAGETAWSGDAGETARAIAAMKRGHVLKVTAKTRAGGRTADTYSLNGFTRALGAIDGACGRRKRK